MDKLERKAAAEKMRAEVAADRSINRPKQHDTVDPDLPRMGEKLPAKVNDVPTVKKQGQNRQGNGPEGTSLIQKTEDSLRSNNDANMEALNASRAALGLPPLPPHIRAK
jgi:hypothetical protein